MARLWRPAQSLDILLDEISVEYPNRTMPDWIIGDQDHASRDSAHNPNELLHVRAADIREGGGIDLARVAELLRRRGKAGDERLMYGGRVIFAGRVCTPESDWEWREYKGRNPHDHHAHVQVSRVRALYDIDRPWRLFRSVAPAPAPTPVEPVIEIPEDDVAYVVRNKKGAAVLTDLLTSFRDIQKAEMDELNEAGVRFLAHNDTVYDNARKLKRVSLEVAK